MTAILAFAAPGVAFVAGDTKRATALFPAIKVHRWSTSVVFAQAGNAPQLSGLIGQMKASRPFLGEDLNGLKTAFENLHSSFHNAAIQAKTQSATPQLVTTDGTLLVADAGSGNVIALDFATGDCSSCSPFGAKGVSQLAAAANTYWSAYGQKLDFWATKSINACVGTAVDWPIDVLIVKPNDPAGALSVQRRYDFGWSGPSDHNFVL